MFGRTGKSTKKARYVLLPRLDEQAEEMGINLISSCRVETVVCLNNKNARPKDYVEIGVDAEDYYRIKDSEKE